MPLAPEYQAMFEQLAAAEPTPSLSEIPVADARDAYRAMRPVNPELTIHATEDRQVSGPLGDIPIRIYRPEGDGPFGTLVYFHGGGWVIGDIDTCDAVCRELASLANIVVVSVDYRMAPEHVFPAAVNDCYAVVEWVSHNQEAVSGNGNIGVAGESAGGNLAAVMALMARDQRDRASPFRDCCTPSPTAQCLSNPTRKMVKASFWKHRSCSGFGIPIAPTKQTVRTLEQHPSTL